LLWQLAAAAAQELAEIRVSLLQKWETAAVAARIRGKTRPIFRM